MDLINIHRIINAQRTNGVAEVQAHLSMDSVRFMRKQGVSRVHPKAWSVYIMQRKAGNPPATALANALAYSL